MGETNMESKAIIIGHTEKPDRITSSSARISTTSGDSQYIFENSIDKEKNKENANELQESFEKQLSLWDFYKAYCQQL